MSEDQVDAASEQQACDPAANGQNPTSNRSDMVFADSLSSELAVLSGDTTIGFMATYTVGVAV